MIHIAMLTHLLEKCKCVFYDRFKRHIAKIAHTHTHTHPSTFDFMANEYAHNIAIGSSPRLPLNDKGYIVYAKNFAQSQPDFTYGTTRFMEN